MLKRFLLQQIDLSKNREFHYFFLRFPLNLLVGIGLLFVFFHFSDFVHEHIEFIDHKYISLFLGVIGFPINVIGLFLMILMVRSWFGICGQELNLIEGLVDDVKLFLE